MNHAPRLANKPAKEARSGQLSRVDVTRGSVASNECDLRIELQDRQEKVWFVIEEDVRRAGGRQSVD